MRIVWSEKKTYLTATILLIILGIGLFFALQKSVTIAVDGNTIKSHVLLDNTVQKVLKKEGIILGEYDRVEPSLNSKIKRDTRITITRAFKVKVIADGKTKEIVTPPIPIKDAIRLAGFKLNENDIVKTIPVTQTTPNQEIEVIRVTESEVKFEEPIAYGVDRITDNTLERGLSKTISPGQNGVALNTIKITYHNGEEVKREVIRKETLQKPKNQVIAMGTITTASRGNHLLNFKEVRYMETSAYTHTGYRTATGVYPEVGMVAVDPNVIPMGTRLYIEGYGFGQAADTGGSIKGDRLDLFMEDRSQCINWGRKKVKVYILN
ncbi:MAG: 3D domain-containing protein [Syntrophomonadaceae bacterium]|jgi:uncharacterized protein YabE (DUF348 family)